MTLWVDLKEYLASLQVRPVTVLIPACLAAGAAVFEGVSLSLLAPLIQGVVTLDFLFIRQTALFAVVGSFMPWLFRLENTGLFILLLAIVFGANLLKISLRYGSSVSIARVARQATHALRQRVFGRYLQYGKLFFDKTSTGYLHQALMDYTTRATRPILEGHQVLNAAFSFVIYLAVLFTISWRLSLVALLIFPALNYAQRVLLKKIKRSSVRLAASLNQFSRTAFNILSSIPLVKAYTHEDKERQRFSHLSDEVAAIEYRMAILHDLIRPTHELVTLAALIVLIAVMAGLVRRGFTVTTASYLVFFYVVLNITNTYGLFQRFKGLLAQAEGPLQEIRKLLQLDDKAVIPEGLQVFQGLTQAISFHHLTFAYPDGRTILNDITFTVPRGSMVAVVGPTGSGKTTLIHLLMRFYDIGPGRLLLDGQDIRDFTLSSLRRYLALVSQDTILFNDTLKNNLTYGLDTVTAEALDQAVRAARLAELVERLPGGLSTEIGDRGVKLSGGERQRIAIARALLKGAQVLILDEATSALDSQTEKLIQAAINEAIVGKTAIVIAHRLSTIQHADQIVVIDQGKLREQGTLNELLAQHGLFYRLWQAQKFY